MVIDLDATDMALHGHQEGRFFHGYYDSYCYLPLFVFWDRHLLSAKLRPANVDAASGSVEEMARIVAQVRARWPRTTIIVRADSGLLPRRPDELVRGQRRALRAWACPQPAAGGRDQKRAGRGWKPLAEPLAGRPASSRTSRGRRWTAGAVRDA